MSDHPCGLLQGKIQQFISHHNNILPNPNTYKSQKVYKAYLIFRKLYKFNLFFTKNIIKVSENTNDLPDNHYEGIKYV